MSRLLESIKIPLLALVRPGALTNVAKVLHEQNLAFRRALVMTGLGETMAYGRQVATALRRADMDARVEAVRAATYVEVDRIKEDVIECYYPDILMAVGGGSVVDVVKLVASERRLPWVSLPTSASNDGICSPVVVLWTENRRKRVGGSMPIGIIADLAVIARSPRRLRLAGVGDLLSNITACTDWELAARRGKASLNGLARMLALSGVRQMLGFRKPDIEDPAFLEIVVEGLILSGIAMEVCGSSRPCSGAEHLISHALDVRDKTGALHGEQVGVAALFCRHLQDGNSTPLRPFAEQVGLPVTPTQLGVDRREFIEAARRGPSMRPGRWTVLCSHRRRTRSVLEKAFDACFCS